MLYLSLEYYIKILGDKHERIQQKLVQRKDVKYRGQKDSSLPNRKKRFQPFIFQKSFRSFWIWKVKLFLQRQKYA